MESGNNSKALPLASGAVLKSPKHEYVIKKTLGSGGFGITYLASARIKVGNIDAETLFAIKEHYPGNISSRDGDTVKPEAGQEDAFAGSLSNFKAEAERLNKLGKLSENIVSVNEVFSYNGTCYYVMEHIDGFTLKEYIDNQKTSDAPKGLDPEQALQIMLPVLSAIGLLHKKNVNHLDIKPDNIMLRPVKGQRDTYTPILIDFGLSVHYDRHGNKTREIGIYGASDGYSPTEQYAGIEKFSPKADIYALAATLYNMLTGTVPPPALTGVSAAKLRAALEGAKTPARMTNAIIHAMAHSADDRTPDIDTFVHELTTTPSSGSVTTVVITKKTKNPDTGGDGPKKPASRWLWIAGAAVAGGIVAAGVIFGMKNCAGKPAPVPAADSVADTNVAPIVADTPAVELPPSDSPKESAKDKPEEQTTSEKEKIEKTNTDKVKPNPTPDPVVKEDKPAPAPSSRKGSISHNGNSYSGEISNNLPNGSGTMVFNKSTTLHGVQIQPGYKAVGEFSNGNFLYGTIYDASGTAVGH